MSIRKVSTRTISVPLSAPVLALSHSNPVDLRLYQGWIRVLSVVRLLEGLGRRRRSRRGSHMVSCVARSRCGQVLSYRTLISFAKATSCLVRGASASTRSQSRGSGPGATEDRDLHDCHQNTGARTGASICITTTQGLHNSFFPAGSAHAC